MQHVRERRPRNEVVVQLAAFGAKSPGRPRGTAQVKPRAKGIVEKDAVASTAVPSDRERVGLIERVGKRLVVGRIVIPVDHNLIALVERRTFFAQTEKVFV